jgi:hypothetical protein
MGTRSHAIRAVRNKKTDVTNPICSYKTEQLTQYSDYATGKMTAQSGFSFRQIDPFFTASRLAVRPNLPPNQWVQQLLHRNKAAGARG